nr:hypothetical protein [Rhodothermus marinus]
MISELIGTFSRKGIFGYKFVALSSVAIASWAFWCGATTCSFRVSRPPRRRSFRC